MQVEIELLTFSSMPVLNCASSMSQLQRLKWKIETIYVVILEEENLQFIESI